MSIPPTLFKYANLAIGTLAALSGVSQLTQIFTHFNVFIQGLIAIILSTFIIYLEFKIPSQLYKFASFYFSFLGRGALHILLASLLGHGVSFIKIFTILLLVFSGIVYFVCHFTKAIEEPDNFKINDNAIMVGDDQFDDDDDDEIV